MKKIIVYTMHSCPYCESAKRLLKQKGLVFEEVLVEFSDEAKWARLEQQTGFKTMPQIFIGDQFIGGYTDLSRLEQTGQLDSLVKD
jgi:glutaredoxin 3